MDIQTAFENLARVYGSHSSAAAAIGFARDHYRAMRNGRVSIPQRTAEYIILKANETEAAEGRTLHSVPSSQPTKRTLPYCLR